MGRANEIAMQHAGQLHVIDILAFALREADVFHALAFAAHAFQARRTFLSRWGHVVHSAASWNSTPFSLAAAYWIALTIFW